MNKTKQLIDRLEAQHSLSIEEYEYLIENQSDELAAYAAEKAIALRKDVYKRQGIIRHTAQFVRQFLTHEFIERLSENIGLPNLLRLFLKLAEQIVYQFFRLLFRADDRICLLYTSLAFFNRNCSTIRMKC